MGRMLRRRRSPDLGSRSDDPGIVCVCTPDGTIVRLDSSQTLDGGDVLSGFSLVLSELFAELDEEDLIG